MTSMIEVNTADLIGPALDWAIAKAAGKNVRILSADNPDGKWQVQCEWRHDGPFWPSQSWAQGGPLIESAEWALPYRATNRYHLGAFEACTPGGFPYNGSTPLIASCRAIVAAEFGDVVSVPAELVQGVES